VPGFALDNFLAVGSEALGIMRDGRGLDTSRGVSCDRAAGATARDSWDGSPCCNQRSTGVQSSGVFREGIGVVDARRRTLCIEGSAGRSRPLPLAVDLYADAIEITEVRATMRTPGHIRHVLFAGALLFATGAAFATENADERRDARDTKQESRDEARDVKDECKDTEGQSNAECRQEKRDTKQEGRDESRDVRSGDQ